MRETVYETDKKSPSKVTHMDLSRFIVCKASAGSGKTYLLVKQYIETAIASPSELTKRFKHILSITFTNAAANGMRQRIMSTLEGIISQKEEFNSLIDEMAVDLGIVARGETKANENERTEIRRRCGILFSTILHHYSDLSVSTIDSFVLRIVRTFAYDFGLPARFGVLIEEKELIQYAIDNVIQQTGSENEEALSEMIHMFLEEQMAEGKSTNIESSLREMAAEALKESAIEPLKALSAYELDDFVALHKYYRKEIRSIEEQLTAAARVPIEAAERAGLTCDDFYFGKNGFYAYFDRLAKENYSNFEKGVRLTTAMEEGGTLYSKKIPKERQRLIEEEIGPLFHQAWDRIQDTFETSLVHYNTYKGIDQNLYKIAFIGKLKQEITNYYQETEDMHISEFNKTISQVIVNEPTPFIYERIGNRYNNYLIDEFQDTSKLQWLNFLPLLDEALSHEKSTNAAVAGQSLVVGDAKQAIYRFREGDVRQFVDLPKVDNPLHGRMLSIYYHPIALNRNWRTLNKIVDFNNTLFYYLMTQHYKSNETLQKIYLSADTSHTPSIERSDLYQLAQHRGGFVEASFCKKKAMMERVRQIIRKQVNDLGYQYRDIMVLAERNKTLTELATYLSEASCNPSEEPIPIVSSDTYVLDNSQAVHLIHEVMKYLYDPTDRQAAAQVLSLVMGRRKLTAEKQHEQLWQLKRERYDLRSALERMGIPFNPVHLKGLSLYDCCEELLRNFNMQEWDTPYIASLLTKVATITQHSTYGIKEFIDYLNNNIDKLYCVSSSEMNAVQLMTVHKSKGLEAPIIIYIQPNKKSPGSKMWVPLEDSDHYKIPYALVNVSNKEDTDYTPYSQEEQTMSEMDKANAFYVALTRPQYKLFTITEWNSEKESKSKIEKEKIQIIDIYKKFFEDAIKDSDIQERLSIQHEDRSLTIGTNREAEFETIQYESYTIGEDSACAAQKGKTDNSMQIDTVVYPSWEKRISVAIQGEATLSGLTTDKRHYGIVVHEILSLIADSTQTDVIITRYCKEHEIAEADQKSISCRINAMIQDPRYSRYFDKRWESRREATILIHGEIRRPDRVVFADGETWVVDFKTGEYNEKEHRHYEKQIAEYAQALREMGYPNVESEIIYL